MKERVNYRDGEFVDYLGQTHKFVVAAVSTSDLDVIMYNTYTDDDKIIPRGLFIGVSVCNPKDEYDEEMGKTIAYNKAVTLKNLNHPAIYTTRPGFINTDVVEALLDNIVRYIKKDPGSVISGYDDAKRKYLKKVEDDKFVSDSSEKLKDIAKSIKKLTPQENKDLNRLVNII